jgi:hypothetical protein
VLSAASTTGRLLILKEGAVAALPGKESVERDSVSALDRFADSKSDISEVGEVP